MKTFASLSALALALTAFVACPPEDEEEETPTQCTWGGATYDEGASWSAGDDCNTCTCGADGAVACTEEACLPPCPDGNQPVCVDYGAIACEAYACFECTDSDDCGDDSWCRSTQEQGTECVPYAGPGATCGGYVLPWTRNICDPSLQCVSNGLAVDLPGVCAACDVDGTPYQAGESFPAGDGCNTCTCDADGQVSCTEMACGCHYLGEDYTPGESFPSYDGCNTCTCTGGGVACTKIGCLACLPDENNVACLVAPCSVSSCDVEGATCVDDYCDGCNARWFDETGNSVCE